MLRRVAQGVAIGSAVFLYAGLMAMSVSAQVPQSANYRFDESVLGAGGMVQANSSSYQATSSAGDLSVGQTESANYQVSAGSKTTNDPALGFSINTPSANFGEFSASTTATATTTFSISNYTSYGYSVFIAGTPPSNQGDIIAPMAVTGPSTIGIDQFGMNLVANTNPTSFGANPIYGLFGVGAATTSYGTSNEYRYVSGESIASAPKSSGVTTYTISYIVNVESLKRGGQYKSSQTIVVTGTY